ncbi:MAG: extracellular solute-binding protein [Candidatus Aerophobetes bacterium]|nr:extracellular solute-binding protein [Candidatus Aerophobetes bacterium]
MGGKIFKGNRLKRMIIVVIGVLVTVGLVSSIIEASEEKMKELRLWASGTQTIEEHWDKLEKELGIKILFADNGNATGPVINKMVFGDAANIYDVCGLQGGAEKELAEQGAILPWDMSLIPNWDEDVWPMVKNIPYHMVNGKRYGIPLTINADSMVYNADKIPVVDTYAYVFDSTFKGKTAMEDWWANSVIFTAIYLKENNIEGLGRIEDPGNLKKDELEAVMKFLIRKKKEGQFRTFWSGWEQGVSLITGGEVWCMTGWEPIVYAAQKKGINAKYAEPKEGYEGWSNDLLLNKGVVKKGLYKTAHEFVNWIYSGYFGNQIMKMRGYCSPTDKVVKWAEEHPDEFDPQWIEEKQKHVVYKLEKKKGKTYWQNVRPDNFKLYEEWWEKFRRS